MQQERYFDSHFPIEIHNGIIWLTQIHYLPFQLCFEDRVLDPANPHLLRATYRRLPVIAVLTSPVFTLIRYPVNANRLSTPGVREMQTIFLLWKTAERPARSDR